MEPPTIKSHTKDVETQTTIILPLNPSIDTTQIENFVLTAFNVEKELERVKILIPLLELSKR